MRGPGRQGPRPGLRPRLPRSADHASRRGLENSAGKRRLACLGSAYLGPACLGPACVGPTSGRSRPREAPTSGSRTRGADLSGARFQGKSPAGGRPTRPPVVRSHRLDPPLAGGSDCGLLHGRLAVSADDTWPDRRGDFSHTRRALRPGGIRRHPRQLRGSNHGTHGLAGPGNRRSRSPLPHDRRDHPPPIQLGRSGMHPRFADSRPSLPNSTTWLSRSSRNCSRTSGWGRRARIGTPAPG
jgi:hypothetical protein